MGRRTCIASINLLEFEKWELKVEDRVEVGVPFYYSTLKSNFNEKYECKIQERCNTKCNRRLQTCALYWQENDDENVNNLLKGAQKVPQITKELWVIRVMLLPIS